MIERPILFSAPMVCAILAGTKTQTRRVVKLPKAIAGGDLQGALADLMWGVTPGLHVPMPDGRSERLRNPWMWPEPSRLWVRETWARDDEDGAILYRADLGKCDDADAWERGRAEGVPRYRWRPSIHMPRWASRITLEITGVRAERLEDICESDAIAEGVVRNRHGLLDGAPCGTNGKPTMFGSACNAFLDLWSSIHCSDEAPANPWVWVIEFKRVAP